jgi:hypothetical protein
VHEATVSVQERGEATDENGADGFRAESERTNDRDLVQAAWVDAGVAPTAAVNTVFTFVVADAAVCLVLAWTPDQAMTLDPFSSFGVARARRLNGIWHDSRSRESGWCVDRGRIAGGVC